MDYSLAFMFSKNKERVLLIQKDRPKWQAGKINGIRGKFDDKLDNDILDTNIREFKEETGIETSREDWKLFTIIEGEETQTNTGTPEGEGYRIFCYKCFSDQIDDARKMETEIPLTFSVRHIHNGVKPLLPNIHWLVPMAAYCDTITITKYREIQNN